MLAKYRIPTAAAFGGVFPGLLRIALDLQNNKESPVTPGPYVALVLFGVMGAAVALIWGEKKVQKAFYLGMGLPSLVQAMTGQLTEAKTGVPPVRVPGAAVAAPPGDGAAFSLFAAPAFAQEPETKLYLREMAPRQPADVEVEYRDRRKLFLVLEDIPRGSEAVLLSADDAVTSTVALEKGDLEKGIELTLPDFARVVYFRSGSARSPSFALPEKPGARLGLRVDVDSSFLGGFLRGLGVRSASQYKFEVTALEP